MFYFEPTCLSAYGIWMPENRLNLMSEICQEKLYPLFFSFFSLTLSFQLKNVFKKKSVIASSSSSVPLGFIVV